MKNYQCERKLLDLPTTKEVFPNCVKDRDMDKMAHASAMYGTLSNKDGLYKVSEELAASICTMAWDQVTEAMKIIALTYPEDEFGGTYQAIRHSIFSTIKLALETMENPVTGEPLDPSVGITEDVMKQIVIWETKGDIWNIPPGPITLKPTEYQLLDVIFDLVLEGRKPTPTLAKTIEKLRVKIDKHSSKLGRKT